MCWWWQKVRKANIPVEDRETFERFGEFVVGLVLAGGFTPSSKELQRYYHGDEKEIKKTYARDWLAERITLHERREDRIETLEWAVLIFVVLGVIADGLLVLRELGCFH